MLICIRVSRHAHGTTRDLLSYSAIGRIDLAAYPSFLIPGMIFAMGYGETLVL